MSDDWVMHNTWLLTIPQSVSQATFLTEMDQVNAGIATKLFKVPLRSLIAPNDTVYVQHNGFVRGWLKVKAVRRDPKGFTCSTTGKVWAGGRYAECAGPYTTVPRVGQGFRTGFQGLRHYTPSPEAE